MLTEIIQNSYLGYSYKDPDLNIVRIRSLVVISHFKNIVVNVSVGSKTQVIASMMACMMFKDMATNPFEKTKQKQLES
jgi:hypothetical protein